MKPFLLIFSGVLAGLLACCTNLHAQSGAACAHFPPAGNDHSQSFGVIELVTNIPVEFTDTVRLIGPTLIQRSHPMMEGNQRFVQTQMLEMNLQGQSAIGPILIQLQRERPSMGQILDMNPDENLDFPAESFFDVYIEAFIPELEMVLHNEEPLRVMSIIDCIPPIGTPYEHFLGGGGVPMLNAQGIQIATITQAVHKLETPLFSVANGGNLDAMGLGPLEFAGRAFWGGAIAEPRPPVPPSWPPLGRISPGLLGLVAGAPGASDELDALSFGMDGLKSALLDVYSFSVDSSSTGTPGTAVDFEVTTGFAIGPPDMPAPPEQQADIFISPLLGINLLMLDEKDATCFLPNMTVTNALATGSNCTLPPNPPGWPGGPAAEDTDALEFENVFKVGFDADGDLDLDTLTGPVFFSLAAASPSVGMAVPDFRPGAADGTATPDDILMTPPPGGSFGVYASGTLDMGLQNGDELDALCLFDTLAVGFLDPNTDRAIFSLAPGSPSLAAGGFSAADLFYSKFDGSFFLYIPAGDLGLLPGDNLDALDCQAPLEILTGVDREMGATAPTHSLYAYPNPFSGSTRLSFFLPRQERVSLHIYSLLGEEVALLLDRPLPPGQHQLEWDARGAAPGLYLCVLRTPSARLSSRLVVRE